MDNFEYEYKRKRRLKKGPIYIIVCIISLVIGAFGGYAYHEIFVEDVSVEETSVYDEISSKIEDDFLDTTKKDSKLKERMMFGMVAALGDPHSAYLNTNQAHELSTSINGSFQGIGVTFTSCEFGAMILDVYEGTPAKKAGLMNGDMITHIQGKSIEGYSSDKVKEVIRGESGTPVTLKILRNGKSQDVVVIRGSVETSVFHEIRQHQGTKVGYLRLTTFGEGSEKLVEKGLQDFKNNNVQNIVLDLRGNGGGYLQAAKDILDLFIEKDLIMFKVQDKNGNEEVYKSTDCTKYQFDKGYILIDGGSASASEVMCGTLKEHLNYTLVGKNTYGKGTVQTQYVLSDSSVLKLTYAKWLTPQGKSINGKGFEPDYEVDTASISDFYMSEFKGPYRYDQVDNHILCMQKMLKELGYQVDREDGYYSLDTKKAVEAFESQYGLTVNGIYEKNDATILLNALTYHLYQELDDQVYLKTIELMK